MKNILLLTVISIALAALCGCVGHNGLIGGGGGNSVYLKSISMTPANPTISLTVSPQPPATQAFVVMGQYSTGSPKEITDQMTWISADTKVATLDDKGVATATGSGQVIITSQIYEPVTQKTLQATTVLTVVPQLTSITVNPATAQIAKGTAQQFAAMGSYNDGSQADITSAVSWSSSSQAAATVSSSPGTKGLALGVSPGTTTISATSGPLSTTPATLTVTNANLVSIAISPGSPTVPLSNSQQFTATGSFDDGTHQDVSLTSQWTSTDLSVARISSIGLLSARGLGSSQITAAMGGVSDHTTATVDDSSVSKIAVLPVSKVAGNTALQMRAVATFKDGSSLEVTQTPGISWTSSDASIAAISAPTGIVTTQNPGTATLTAQLGSKSGSAALNVSDATIQALSVAPGKGTIAAGTTQNMIALATFSDKSGTFQQDISPAAGWTSDNTGAATLSLSDQLQELATGISTGTANVTAAFSDTHGNLVSSSVPLTVSGATLTGIGVAPGNAGANFGGGQQFVATGNFTDGTQQDLTPLVSWSSSNGAVASVSSFGFADASGPGQTSIVAALGSQTGSSGLVVNPGVLSRIDICPASTASPLTNCPPLDPDHQLPPYSFAKAVPYAMIAIGTYTDGSRANITSSVHWSTSAPSIASISNDPGIPWLDTGVTGQGVATGSSAGTVTLTATAGAVSGTSDVVVTDATPLTLTLTPTNGSLPLGFTQQFSVVATFNDTTTETVTPYVRWTTSDPSIVIVYPGGLAYPNAAGTATINATLGSATGATTLTVQ